LNGTAFESAIVPRSRAFWLLLDDSVLGAAGVSVGDTVRVAVEPTVQSGGSG
jgi:SOS-response transcriptional repressor LexA